MNKHIPWRSESGWWLETQAIPKSDGTLAEKGYIRHPGAVAIVPITAEGQVLMLKQYRLTLDQTILEIPAGTRGWDEDWVACAQRELREETGYRAESLQDMGFIWSAPGVSDEVMRLYLATDLKPDPLPQDDDEQIEVVPFDLEELADMALDGRLQDAKSVVALLRLELGFLKSGD